MAGIRDLVKDSSIYGVGSALQKFIGVLLIPIYTRVLSPADYGLISTMMTLTFFISTIFDFGLNGATGRYFFIADNERDKGKVIFTSLTIRMLTSFLVMIIFLPNARGLSSLVFGTDIYADIVVVSILLLATNNLAILQDNLFRWYRQPLKYTMITIIRALLYPGLGILFVVVLRKGVWGERAATLVGTAIMMIISFFYFGRKKYTFEFDNVWAKKMFIFGFPLIFYGIAQWFYSASDRFFLLKYSDLRSIGLYSIGSTFSQPLLMINTAIEMSIGTLVMTIFHKEIDPEKPKTRKTASDYWDFYLLISIPIAGFLSIFGTDLMKLLTTKDYIEGAIAIPFLAFSNIVYMNIAMTCFGMNLMEKTRPLAKIMIITAVIKVILNFYFIPKYSFIGAAITTILCNIIFWVLAYRGSQKYFHMKWKLIPSVLYMTIAFLISVSVPFLQIKSGMHINIFVLTLLFMIVLVLPVLVKLIRVQQVIDGYYQVKEIIARWRLRKNESV